MPEDSTTEQKVEQLKEESSIQKALEQTSGPKQPPPEVSAKAQSPVRKKFYLGTYVLLLLLLSGVFYLLRLGLVGIGSSYFPFVQRVLVGAMAVITVVALLKATDVFLVSRLNNTVSEYNIRRILNLVAALLILFIGISILFANWYTAVLSLGLVSLILGFALQTPITSVIGWLYILIRTPYRVGDRIKIGDATGDVIDLSYLDTTLWEFGGEYLSTDHPSGRLIKFPNSSVLNSAVYNYSWPLFPYVWNEIKFNVAYESDLEYVAQTMQRIAEEELGEAMLERVRMFRELLAETPVDELEVKEHPSVFFRVSNNTWLEAIVRYLVQPRQAGRVKNRLIDKMLTELNSEPERVMFPKGAAR